MLDLPSFLAGFGCAALIAIVLAFTIYMAPLERHRPHGSWSGRSNRIHGGYQPVDTGRQGAPWLAAEFSNLP